MASRVPDGHTYDRALRAALTRGTGVELRSSGKLRIECLFPPRSSPDGGAARTAPRLILGRATPLDSLRGCVQMRASPPAPSDDPSPVRAPALSGSSSPLAQSGEHGRG